MIKIEFKIGDKVKATIDCGRDITLDITEILAGPDTEGEYAVVYAQGWPCSSVLKEGDFGITKENLSKKAWWVAPSRMIILESFRCEVGERRPRPIKPDGCVCVGCQNFSHYAVPNLSDGTFACFSCRSSNGWRYK